MFTNTACGAAGLSGYRLAMEEHANDSACGRRECHRVTVGAAVIRVLEANLLFTGPMKRTKLARAVRADSRPHGTFDEAVRQAVRQGKIHELPRDWLTAARR
jgi:hypothetical protein